MGSDMRRRMVLALALAAPGCSLGPFYSFRPDSFPPLERAPVTVQVACHRDSVSLLIQNFGKDPIEIDPKSVLQVIQPTDVRILGGGGWLHANTEFRISRAHRDGPATLRRGEIWQGTVGLGLPEDRPQEIRLRLRLPLGAGTEDPRFSCVGPEAAGKT
jgi:hypothetical protein